MANKRKRCEKMLEKATGKQVIKTYNRPNIIAQRSSTVMNVFQTNAAFNKVKHWLKNSPDLTSPIKMNEPDNNIIELFSPASQDLKLDLEDMEIVIGNDNSCLHELKPKELFNETNPPIVIEIPSDQVETYYDLGCKPLSNSECNIPSVSEHEPTQSETPTKNKIIPEEYEPTDRLILDELECNVPFALEHEPTQNEIPIINKLFPEEREPNVRLQLLDSSINIDPEYINPIVVVETGRKRSINNKKKDKQLKKNSLPFAYEIRCAHQNITKKKICYISELTKDDLDAFKSYLCSLSSKIEQDKYILTLMSIGIAKRTERKKTDRSSRIYVTYSIPSMFTINKINTTVCAEAFSSVTSISRRRLNMISKNFQTYHTSPKETRGGSRQTDKDTEITLSIIEHIQMFKCIKSHHTRRDTDRSYLPPGLSCNYMFMHWKKKRLDDKLPLASLSKYYHIFTTKFNLSFGHPRQDVCSFCTEQKVKIGQENNENIKQILTLELNLHKKKAKRFFELLKEQTNDSLNCSFDMMQTQPLPKLSVTDVFYSRQVWIYNLTFVVSGSDQLNDKCFLYTWNEAESGRGPNEICSALIDFLEKLEYNLINSGKSVPATLNLFSDSCSAQNKNQYTMMTLLHYINYKSKVFKNINHIFPVRGHSYMPPDRVFGRIEKELNKKETIISPQEYYTVFEKYATVNIYNKDFNVFDYKTSIKTIVKSKNDFKSTEQKVFTYIKGEHTVGISKTYGGLLDKIEVVKRNGKLLSMTDNLIQLPKTNHIKLPKQKDVKNLMRFFEVPQHAKQFYEDIFQNSVNDEGLDENIALYEPDDD